LGIQSSKPLAGDGGSGRRLLLTSRLRRGPLGAPRGEAEGRLARRALCRM